MVVNRHVRRAAEGSKEETEMHETQYGTICEEVLSGSR